METEKQQKTKARETSFLLTCKLEVEKLTSTL